MGRIKKVRFTRKLGLKKNDRFDKAFWEEFLRLESMRTQDTDGLNEKGRLVTVTIKDEKSGEEWVIEKVRLFGGKEKRLGD